MFTSPRGIIWAIAVVLAGVGGVLLGVGLASQQHAPQPTISQAGPQPTTTLLTATVARPSPATSTQPLPSAPSEAVRSRSSGPVPHSTSSTVGRSLSSAASPASGSGSTAAPTQRVLSASVPVSIRIPSIGVKSTLLQLGLNPDSSIQVPPLDDPQSKAGWYKYSPTPGQIGPTVILGHVDSAKHGPAVFFKLGALQPGATVEVTRTDRTVAVFTVDKVVAYPKAAFPSDAVYGNIDHPGLRLITCGGTFDRNAGSYESSIVAFATLTSDHPSSP